MSPEGDVSTRPRWEASGEWKDIRYETWEGIAKLTINRP